jgi:hypothetical protein
MELNDEDEMRSTYDLNRQRLSSRGPTRPSVLHTLVRSEDGTCQDNRENSRPPRQLLFSRAESSDGAPYPDADSEVKVRKWDNCENLRPPRQLLFSTGMDVATATKMDKIARVEDSCMLSSW